LKLAIKIEPDNQEIESLLTEVMISNRNKIFVQEKGKN
jgi:hypothetical protein